MSTGTPMIQLRPARARRFYERNGWADEGLFDYPAATSTGAVPVPAHRYTKPVS